MGEKLEFIDKFKISFEENIFLKILISKPVSKGEELIKISIRTVKIKNKILFSFLFKYKTKDITKNFSFDDTLIRLDELLGIEFKNSVLFTQKNDITLSYNKKIEPKILYTKATGKTESSKNHNIKKNRLINIEKNIYLKELGILSESGEIIKNKQSKFKQINKYIETLEGIIKKSNINKEEEINIADMGSGKGYLTFATYDFLKNKLGLNINVIGIEMRENLVELCNSISEKCNFTGLSFIQNNIEDFKINKLDILIALHACDTATDDAIFKGITLNSEIIITSPCCHKQIRKELNPENELKCILNHGILKERQAELVTDTMRGLVLEAYGYKTQIFEFITDEHTHKNILIVGIKNSTLNKNNKIEFFQKISNLKQMFGINNFYLEDLFKT